MLNETVGAGFTGRYEELGAKVGELARPLTNEQFWMKPFAFGNSFGHLVLHLTGNLNYYIGTEIAGTGYVRDRDREFTDAARPAKGEVMKRFADAVAMVARTARAQSDEDWTRKYKALREEEAGNRFNIFLRCATHLHLHVGQMMYLQFELMRGKR
ncbi:MAG: DinB family protein [Terriglobales bacterium]